MFKGKKGSFNMLTAGAIGAGSFFLILVVMALIFANIRSSPLAPTYNSTGHLTSGDPNVTTVLTNAGTANTTYSSLGTIFVYVIFLVAVIGLLALIGYGAYRALK